MTDSSPTPPEFLISDEGYVEDIKKTSVEGTPTIIHSIDSNTSQAAFGICSGSEPENWQLGQTVPVSISSVSVQCLVGDNAPSRDTVESFSSVFIDRNDMEKLSVEEDDIVWVAGEDRTPCLARECVPADMGLSIARLGPTERSNANISLGEKVTLSKAKQISASSVELGVGFHSESAVSSIKENLINRPVEEGDYLKVPRELVENKNSRSGTPDLGSSSKESVSFKVLSVSPDRVSAEAAKITNSTHIRISQTGHDNETTENTTESVDEEKSIREILSDVPDTDQPSISGILAGNNKYETDGNRPANGLSDSTDEHDTDLRISSTNNAPDADIDALSIDTSQDKIPEPPAVSLPETISYRELDIGESVGKGGSADVRTARVADEDVQIALKRLKKQWSIDKKELNQFGVEAEQWARFDDKPHVVSLIDWGKVPQPWIAMEYLEGGDLRDRLAETDTGLPIYESLWIATVLTETLADVHHLGIRHLDIQARNVIFAKTPDNKWDFPKIGDWGEAKKQVNDNETTALNPKYAAPEQFEEDVELDHRTDIYQLGGVIYELFTGKPPTAAGAEGESISDRMLPTSPSELRVDLPATLDDVILQALEPVPSDRYDRAIYFYDALDSLYET